MQNVLLQLNGSRGCCFPQCALPCVPRQLIVGVGSFSSSGSPGINRNESMTCRNCPQFLTHFGSGNAHNARRLLVPSGHLFHSYDPLAEAIKATTTTNVRRRRCCTVGDRSEPASGSALPDFVRVSVFKINENRFAARLLPWQPINMAKRAASLGNGCGQRAMHQAGSSSCSRDAAIWRPIRQSCTFHQAATWQQAGAGLT